jgi:hypothetical protein
LRQHGSVSEVGKALRASVVAAVAVIPHVLHGIPICHLRGRRNIDFFYVLVSTPDDSVFLMVLAQEHPTSCWRLSSSLM